MILKTINTKIQKVHNNEIRHLNLEELLINS